MIQHPSPAPTPSATANVWDNLTADLRAHAVRLLAQLAYTCATSHMNNPAKESNDASPSNSCEDPPRPS